MLNYKTWQAILMPSTITEKYAHVGDIELGFGWWDLFLLDFVKEFERNTWPSWIPRSVCRFIYHASQKSKMWKKLYMKITKGYHIAIITRDEKDHCYIGGPMPVIMAQLAVYLNHKLDGNKSLWQ